MSNQKYIIYGKQGCASCVQAKQLLEAKGIDYSYLILGTDYTMTDFTLMTQQRTFPYIEVVNLGTERTIAVGTFADLRNELGQREAS